MLEISTGGGYGELGLDIQPIDLSRVYIYGAICTLSGAVSVFHGYRRNSAGQHPVAWAIAWGALGFLFPIITPVIAVAQGYGKPA
jgi:hypothetical protein